MSTLKKPYYDYVVGHNNVSFMELVMIRKNIEDGIKLGRLTNMETSDHRSNRNGSGKKGTLT